jgi:hypothetical protein
MSELSRRAVMAGSLTAASLAAVPAIPVLSNQHPDAAIFATLAEIRRIEAHDYRESLTEEQVEAINGRQRDLAWQLVDMPAATYAGLAAKLDFACDDYCEDRTDGMVDALLDSVRTALLAHGDAHLQAGA